MDHLSEELRTRAASFEREYPVYSILMTQAAEDREDMRRENMELREALADLTLEIEGRLFPFGECTMKSRQSAWEPFIRACKLVGKTHIGMGNTPLNIQKHVEGENNG